MPEKEGETKQNPINQSTSVNVENTATTDPVVAATPTTATPLVNDIAKNTPKSKKAIFDSTGFVIVSVLLIGLIYSLFVGYKALKNNSSNNSASVISINSKATATPAPLTLNLNYPHRRQGEPVTVNPDIIGKTDPFSR